MTIDNSQPLKYKAALVWQTANAVNMLSNSQLNKLKSAVKNQTEVTLRMTIKMFNWNNLPHELLLTTRQKQN